MNAKPILAIMQLIAMQSYFGEVLNRAMTEHAPITPLELAELRARLDDAETHRKGLLEHAHNLEYLLREKDSDLKQTKEMLVLLEARCYRYEQMLQDYGVDPLEDES